MNDHPSIQRICLILFVLCIGVACSTSGAPPDAPTATVVADIATPIPPTETAVSTNTATSPPPTETATPAPPTETPTITPVPVTPTAVPATEPGVYSQELTLEDGRVLEYAISIPPSYTGAEAVPLIVSLTGGLPHINLAAVGNSLNNVDRLKDTLSELEVIIISPYPVNEFYATADGEFAVLTVVDYVTDLYNIDPDKTLITGGSRGATGAWYITARNQDRFAAAIMGAGSPAQRMNSYEWTLPLYIIYPSTREGTIYPFPEMEELVQQLTAMGYAIELVTYEEPFINTSPHDWGVMTRPLFTEKLLEAIPWLLEIWSRAE